MRKLIVSWCILAVILLGTALSADTALALEKKLVVDGGLGYENNVYYLSAGEKGSLYGFIDLGYRYKRPLPESDWKFLFDGIYSAKIFASETAANDYFASFFMSVNRDFGNWQLGVSSDPQYTRFVTGDTSGGTVSEGKQRILSNKIRFYTIFELSDSSDIEGGLGFRTRDYKNSDSDYGEVSFDAAYRREVSKNMRLNLGLLYERRDFKNRAAINGAGTQVAGKTLLLKRLRPSFKLVYSPGERSSYSFKYRYKSSVDSFEDWYSYKENTFLGKAKYRVNGGLSLAGSLRLDLRDYEKRVGDTGGDLGEQITTANITLSLPGVFENSSWFASVNYSGFASDQKSLEYINSGISLGLKIVR